MAKISDSERALRVNTAVKLVHKHTVSEGAIILAQQYGISKRQAYRYMQQAVRVGKRIPIPDHKAAFTIKLSEGLISALRAYARQTEQTLSDIVSQALRVFLKKRGHG